jgi:hypothetical protein
VILHDERTPRYKCSLGVLPQLCFAP